MSKHTSGPWQIIGSSPLDGSDCFFIMAQPNPAMRGFTKEIATANGFQRDEEATANAHLIAAAPDMLGALKQASFCLRELLQEDKDALYTLDIINQALAKAEGKQ